MSSTSLVYPMLALVLLTFGVVLRLFRARVRAVRERHADVSYFRTFQGSGEPEYSAKVARHFANLFETPVLFYAGCLAAMVTGTAGVLVVGLAWAFVVARVIHAAIHLGGNRLRNRIPVYFVSWLILLAMWILIAGTVALRSA